MPPARVNSDQRRIPTLPSLRLPRHRDAPADTAPAPPFRPPRCPRGPTPLRTPRSPDLWSTPLNPDFELYDNVGRTSDQIHSHNTGTPTTDDLHRWARRDTEAFLQRHPLPAPAPHSLDLRPFEAALAEAATPVEASAVILAALDAAEQVIQDLSTLLLHAGYRYPRDQRRTPESPRKLTWSASSGLLAAMAAAEAGIEAALREEYDPAPRTVRARTDTPLPPAPPPSAPPAPRP